MNKLPAGTYYVGDLCYVLGRDDYDEIVCTFRYNDGEVHTVNGYTFAWTSTAYGDGCYTDSKGNEYPVDAGLIGILRVDNHPEMLEDMLQHNIDVDAKEGYPFWKHNLFTFDKEFSILFEDGVFNIDGNIIDTNGSEDEEDCDW